MRRSALGNRGDIWGAGGAGDGFAYKEFRASDTFWQAVVATLVLVALTASLAIAPLRWLLAKFLPKPGQGETPCLIAWCHPFHMSLHAMLRDPFGQEMLMVR